MVLLECAKRLNKAPIVVFFNPVHCMQSLLKGGCMHGHYKYSPT